MDIISRQDAITRQLYRYYTGKPCKRGHLCERYTINSLCIECLHPKISSYWKEQRKKEREERTQKEREQRTRYITARRRMIRCKFRVFDQDFDFFVSTILIAAIQREPLIARKDILTLYKPLAMEPGKAIHAFKVFPEDKETLYDLQDSLERERRHLVAPVITPPKITMPVIEWPEWRA